GDAVQEPGADDVPRGQADDREVAIPGPAAPRGPPDRFQMRRLMTRPVPTLWLLALLLIGGCGRPTADSPPAADPARIELPGLHNVYRITDKLYSGSSPEGDEGFRSLRELGVKTVISVD